MDQWHPSAEHALSSSCLCDKAFSTLRLEFLYYGLESMGINIIKLWVGITINEHKKPLAAFEGWWTQPPALEAYFAACLIIKAVESLDYFVVGRVVRIQAGDMEIQIQLGTRKLIHLGTSTTAPPSDSSTFSDSSVCLHILCHRPFLAEVAAFQHSALRLAEQGERNWLSHVFIPLLPQGDSEYLPFHYSQKSSLYSSTVIYFLIEV